MELLRSRKWVVGRRMVLVAVALVIGIQIYGNSVLSWFRGPDPANDIVITHAEFRPDIPGEKPAWIIGLHNTSQRHTYEQIRLDAEYFDEAGTLLETDRLVVSQKLAPGVEQMIGSTDIKDRGSATRGTLRVFDALTAN